MTGLRVIYVAVTGDTTVVVPGKSLADARRKAVRAYGSVNRMFTDVTCPDCPLQTCNKPFGSEPLLYSGQIVNIERRCHTNVRQFSVPTTYGTRTHHSTLLEAVIYAIRLESGIGLARLHALRAEIQKRLRGEP